MMIKTNDTKALINDDLYKFKTIIYACRGIKVETDFLIPALENLALIEGRIAILEAIREPNKDYIKYENDRKAIMMQHCRKDAQGNLQLYTDNSGTTLALPDHTGKVHGTAIANDGKKDAFLKELATLSEKNDKIITTQNDRIAKFNEVLLKPIKPMLALSQLESKLLPTFDERIHFDYVKTLLPLLK